MTDQAPADPAAVLTEKEWQELARNMLKVELKRRNVTYDDLAKRLRALGVEETEVSIRNKISRGTFQATFLLQCMKAMGVQLLPLRPSMTSEVILSPELLAAAQGLRWPSQN